MHTWFNPLRKIKILGKYETILLAYQTFGVEYGDLGIFPLYAFYSIAIKNPRGEYLLGILNMIF